MKSLVNAVLLAVFVSAFTATFAQNYPNRPVRTLVPLAAGGGMDTVTRALSVKLGEAFEQTFVVDNWYGLIAPAKTPAAIVNRLASAANKAMQAPEMMKSLRAEGSEAVSGTPDEFAAHIKAEHAQWRRVVKEAGIRGT